jgi:hypothetical protein
MKPFASTQLDQSVRVCCAPLAVGSDCPRSASSSGAAYDGW